MWKCVHTLRNPMIDTLVSVLWWLITYIEMSLCNWDCHDEDIPWEPLLCYCAMMTMSTRGPGSLRGYALVPCQFRGLQNLLDPDETWCSDWSVVGIGPLTVLITPFYFRFIHVWELPHLLQSVKKMAICTLLNFFWTYWFFEFKIVTLKIVWDTIMILKRSNKFRFAGC